MTKVMPTRPEISISSASPGITSIAAINRGSTSIVTGSMPMVRMAATSSFTTMVPNSAAKAEPVRPASTTAASSGPNSRSRLMVTRFAT